MIDLCAYIGPCIVVLKSRGKLAVTAIGPLAPVLCGLDRSGLESVLVINVVVLTEVSERQINSLCSLCTGTGGPYIQHRPEQSRRGPHSGYTANCATSTPLLSVWCT